MTQYIFQRKSLSLPKLVERLHLSMLNVDTFTITRQNDTLTVDCGKLPLTVEQVAILKQMLPEWELNE